MNTFAIGSLPVHFSVAKLFTFRWQYTGLDFYSTGLKTPVFIYICHVLLRFTLVLICNTKISEKSDMAKS